MNKTQKKYFSPILIGFLALIFVGLGFLLLPHFAQAVSFEDVGASLGFGVADLKDTIVNVIKWALGLLGLAAVIMMIYGGFVWLTARGNQNQIDKAKRILINAAIGLVIVLLSWAIVLLILRFTNQVTGGAAAAGVCGPAAEPPVAFGSYGCQDCVDTPPSGDDLGIFVDNGSCGSIPDPDDEKWYALNEKPAVSETNVSLCRQAVEIFGGLRIPEDNNAKTGTYTVNEVLNPGNILAGTTYLDTDHTATFLHEQDFKPNTEYEVKRADFLSSGLTPLPLTLPPEWRFTTGTEGDDTPPTVSVVSPTGTINCLKPEIDSVFSEPMLPLSVHVDNINISPTPSSGAKLTSIVMNPSLDGFTASFDKPLDPSTTYTVTLNADKSIAIVDSPSGGKYIKGFKDMCIKNALDGNANGTADGTPMDDYSWTFTTADTMTIECTPKISSIEPTAYYGNDFSNSQQALTITGEFFGVTGTGVLFPNSELATTVNGASSRCFNSSAMPAGFRPKQTNSVACIRPVDWTPTKITTLVPAGLTPSVSPVGPVTGGATDGPVIIQKSENSPPSDAVDIQTPHIDWVSPNNGKEGTFITINGTHFGNTPGTVYFRKTDGTEVTGSVPACAGSDGWTEDAASPDKRSQIIVQVPAGFAVNELTDIQVKHNTLLSATGRSNLYRFTVNDQEHPGLCKIVPQCHNTGGGTLTAEGQGFGSDISKLISFYKPSDPTKPVTNGELDNLDGGAGTVESKAQDIGNDTYTFQITVDKIATNPLSYKIPCLPAPAVVQDAACNLPGTMPSPNPYPGSTNVCRNIRLQVRFNQPMNFDDVIDFNNVRIDQCGTGDAFTCPDSPPEVSLASINFGSPFTVATYTPSVILTPDTWYRVTLNGANLHSTPAGVAIGQDYIWTFRVRTDPTECTTDAVSIEPQNAGPVAGGVSTPFDAQPITNSCAILKNDASFTWSTNDASLAPVVPPNGIVSTVSNPNDHLNTTVPPGNNNGTATLTAKTGGKSGTAKLIVDRTACETDDDCNNLCPGSTCKGSGKIKHCSPYINNIDSPSGPPANIVNVQGCFFGQAMGNGKVTFAQGAVSEKGSFAICGPQNWSDTEIRVQAQPDGALEGPWSVTVTTDTQYGAYTSYPGTYTVTNSCLSNTGGSVEIPAEGMPLICNISPSAAKEGSKITFNGDRFSTTEGQTFYTKNQDPLPGNFDLTGNGTFTKKQVTNSTVPANIGVPNGSSFPKATVGTLSNVPDEYCIASPARLDISCNANSECSSGCCSDGICQPDLSLCTGGLIKTIKPASGILACRNSTFQITFRKLIQRGTITNNSILLLNSGGDPVDSDLSVIDAKADPPEYPDDYTQVTIIPKQPLTIDTYSIFIKGGSGGVVANDGMFMFTDYPFPPVPAKYTVDAKSVICKIDHIAILRNAKPITSDTFFCSKSGCLLNGVVDDFDAISPDNQHGYTVEAYSKYDEPLSIASQTWTQADPGGTGSASNTYNKAVKGAVCSGDDISNTYCGTSLNVPSGTENLSVKVIGTPGSGEATTSISVNSFLCANPWPEVAASWPFKDPDYSPPSDLRSQNFETAFCRDDIMDYRLSASPTPGTNPSEPALVKEYFFFVEKYNGASWQRNGDAIGFRVYTNAGMLSPQRWYKRQLKKDFSGSQTEIDGYPAIREGRTVYITGVNDFDAAPSAGLLPYTYIISHTDNADANTVKIFEQIIKNLKFNQNVVWPFLADEKAAIRRDVKRLQSYWEIAYALETYKAAKGYYPKLETGSFLKGISTSNWPSWQSELGKALGITMPTDPVGWDKTLVSSKCPSPFDPNTCWNQNDKIFTYPTDGTQPPKSKGLLYAYNPNLKEPKLFGTLEYATTIHPYADSLIINSVQPPASGIITDNPCSSAPGSSCAGFNYRMSAADIKAVSDIKLLLNSDAVAPTVEIASPPPPSGDLSGLVDVTATAVDLPNPGASGIAKLDFQILDPSKVPPVLLRQGFASTPDNNKKYHWSWDTRSLTNGAYRLSVTATDKAGNKSPAKTKDYTLNNPQGDITPPILTLTNPIYTDPPAEIIWGFADVALSANAADNAGGSGLAKVEFYLGNSKLGEAASSPANITVPGSEIQKFQDGDYLVSAVAYDNAGNTAISRQVKITVNKNIDPLAPVLEITTPADGSEISGAVVDVIADATDNIGIDRVEFKVEHTTLPKSLTYTAYTAPYIYAMPTANFVAGTVYTIQAEAFDRYGNSATHSHNVTFMATPVPDLVRPSISDFTPPDGVSVANTVPIYAVFTDNIKISKVRMDINGIQVPIAEGYLTKTDAQWILNYPWNTLPEPRGPLAIALTVYDTSNNATTIVHTVNVDNRLGLVFRNPSNNAQVRDAPAGNIMLRTQLTTCGGSNINQTKFYLDTNPVPLFTATRLDSRLDRVRIDGGVPTLDGCGTQYCQYRWSSLTSTSNGRHTLTAIGSDVSGCQGGQRISVIVDNVVSDITPPTISSVNFSPILKPDNYTNQAEGIIVNAADNIGGSGLATIELFVDGLSLNAPGCGASPCLVDWVPVKDGVHTIHVVVKDVAENEANQDVVINYDSNKPVITWDSPADGTSNVTPITLVALVSDPDKDGYNSGVNRVAFNASNFWQMPVGPNPWTGIPVTDIWKPILGWSPFYALAIDRAGNSAQSAAVNLNIMGPDDPTPPVFESLTFNPPLTDVGGIKYAARGNYTVTATYHDNQSGMSQINITRDGATVNSCDVSSIPAGDPASCSWIWDTSTATNGATYAIGAHATNNQAGDSGPTIQAVRVDNVNPIAIFMRPSAGATVSRDVIIDVAGVDLLSGIASVTIYGTPGGLVVSPTLTSGDPSNGRWTYTWDTTAYADGAVQLRAEVRDQAGNLLAPDITRNIIINNHPVCGAGNCAPPTTNCCGTSCFDPRISHCCGGSVIYPNATPCPSGCPPVCG
ncbi:MAG: Ig-like domain-containing protein [Patescibacteria group bacterium]